MKVSRHSRRERGQALAEYHVLYPGSILLAYLGFILLGTAQNTVFGAGRDALMEALTGNEVPPAVQDLDSPPDEQEELEEQDDQELSGVCLSDVTGQDGGSFCEQHGLCAHIEPGDDLGCADFNECSVPILPFTGVVVIKGGKNYTVFVDPSGEMTNWQSEDGCYQVTVQGQDVSWRKTGGGKSCKDVSHVQAWSVPSLDDCP